MANLFKPLLLIAVLTGSAAHAAPPQDARVERNGAVLTVRWRAAGPVDVLVSAKADSPVSAAQLISAADADGVHRLDAANAAPRYFILRDQNSGDMVRVAERLVPLVGGSNFRDIGGYPAADGKRVKWGAIYRSGGQAMLTPADLERIKALHLANLVDLRSSEERVLAPTKIDGVPYTAIGYSMGELLANFSDRSDPGAGYRAFPKTFAPQLRQVFRKLLAAEGPLAYNCSAGQDRTGFTTAMVLSALGVSRDDVMKDYHLSTALRSPQNELPPIDAATAARNPIAGYFAKYQTPGVTPKANPLYDAKGKPLLTYALDQIDADYGSVTGYLAKEIGIGPAEIARLRALYTE